MTRPVRQGSAYDVGLREQGRAWTGSRKKKERRRRREKKKRGKRKREKEEEKKRKRGRKKKRGTGEIHGDGREPVVASMRSDAHKKRGVQKKKLDSD